ncbi:ParB/RepB/Spo0J family partition protein [soil metagenome]
MKERRGLGRGLGALIPSGPSRGGEGWERAGLGAAAGTGAVTEGGGDGTSPGRDEVRAPDQLGPRNGLQVVPGGAPTTSEPAARTGAFLEDVSISAVAPNPRQPRRSFDEDAHAELVASIRAVGLLQPIVVRPIGGGRYELVMGERRWRAAQAAGLTVVPAVVRDTADDAMLRDALIENLHREQLNPLEEAAAYDQLLSDFGCTHEQLADRVGRSRSQVTNTLRLLRLPAHVQRRVAAGVLSAGHARALLGVDDPEQQDRLAQRIVAEGLSVRAVEELVAVGGAAPATSRQRLRAPLAPALTELATRLSDRFETRVRVDLGRRKGRIVVEFASIDDLERIVSAMTPSVEPDRDPAPAAG